MPFGMLLRSPGRGVVCRDGGVWAEIIFMYLPLSIEIDSCITAKACHYFHAIFFAKLDLTLTVLSLSLRTSLHRSFPSPPLSSSASQPQPQLSVSFYFFYFFVYSFICHHMGRQPQTPLFHLVHFHQSFGISSLLIQLTVVLSKVLHLVLTYYSGSNVDSQVQAFILSLYLSYSLLFSSYLYQNFLSLHICLQISIILHPIPIIFLPIFPFSTSLSLFVYLYSLLQNLSLFLFLSTPYVNLQPLKSLRIIFYNPY